MSETDLLFYDGYCGLCHRTVLFILARDDGSRFRFAPLQGETFALRVPPSQRAGLPDSIVLLHGEQLLLRSDAVLHILRRLGRGWYLLAALGSICPRPFQNWLYDGVAKIRHRLFKKPEEACPLLPPELRSRFLP